MTRVVLDANILASGAVSPRGGTPATVVDTWQAGLFAVVLSQPILSELERTLADPYFARRLSVEDVAACVAMVRRTAITVPLTVEGRGVATLQEDDLVLATAVSAQAGYLVSGDAKLQALGTYQGVLSLSAPRFLEALETQGAP